MRENFLHYVWKFKKFKLTNLKSTSGESIVILNVGIHNHNSGPDFLNAKVRIGDQVWAGNIEIHIRSGDWYLHNHENDVTYDTVILHVVFNDDKTVLRKDGTEIPTIELGRYIHSNVYANYNRLLGGNRNWINCETEFATVDDFIIDHWLERLYIERLEKRTQELNDLLLKTKNNWEAVLFKLLARSFGLKINAESFFSIANSISFSVIRKMRSDPILLESLFFGQAGLLNDDLQIAYYKELQRNYAFLKTKFKLSDLGVVPPQFFRLRPLGFPTIRLSQFAR
ncbi:MAG: DUF2851 family protein, partial [Psychroserpens sp.]|nr:DUF2851 family protein [Psychroserpens sp.]